MRADGAVLLRGLVPEQSVLEVREAFLRALDRVGWLTPGSTMDAPHATGHAVNERAGVEPQWFAMYTALQRLEAFHALAHHPRITAAAAALLGAPVLVHPRKIARVGIPEVGAVGTPAHQDHRLVQGTVDVLTCWVPLGDCSPELGALAVLPRSHRLGVCEVDPVGGTGGMKVAVDGIDDSQDWFRPSYRAGDVIVFHSLTVHGAPPNQTDVVRVSCDLRYQRATEPVVANSLHPHYAPHVPPWAELTQGWTNDRFVAAPAEVVIAAPRDPFSPEWATPLSDVVA